MSLEKTATDAARRILQRAKEQGKLQTLSLEDVDALAESVGAGVAATRDEITRSGMELLGRVMPKRRV